MVDLFNENTLFVFFFAMVAIYNYSALKEYQRMAIIYILISRKNYTQPAP